MASQKMTRASSWPPESFKDRLVRSISPPYSFKAIMVIFFAIAAILVIVVAVPVSIVHSSSSATVSPQVASISIIGNVTDPAVSRDSCVSTRIGNRALWTCRDTSVYNVSSDESVLPLVTNSASWTGFASSGALNLSRNGGPIGAGSTGSNTILQMYGGSPTSYPAYFPLPSDACPVSGACADKTRWTLWPSAAPLVSSTTKSNVVAYSWIPKEHYRKLDLLNPNPPTSLYRSTYIVNGDSTSTALPRAQLVAQTFWKRNSIGYGVYGGLVVNGTAYLYGKTGTSPPGVALAKVASESIEDISQYSYYVNGDWTTAQPSLTDTSANLQNAGTGGQGAFYYSGYFNSYIWIGGGLYAGTADFYLSTAPAPEGPWIQPYRIYSGANGDSSLLPSYSCVPNPALLTSDDESGIYLTWTQSFQASTYGAYVTPLVYVKWK